MSADPILILQLQRLGDLVLTFPLLIDLARRYPKNPLWVVAEPAFFKELMPFAPKCVFFSPEKLAELGLLQYEAVINLSSRKDAAICAHNAKSGIKFGPVFQNNSFYINGFWQLYRTSLTANNRHNLFHWADLNRLDLGFPLTPLQTERKTTKKTGSIGLFIGASNAAKRPECSFWITLARKLAQKGLKPFLLGGPAEKETGEKIANAAYLQASNFCGKTSIAQLAAILTNLDLLITPDTGPMHLADWLGMPVLNLSMGNVKPQETGPPGSGQWIAQANMSCSGCWQCTRPHIACKNMFNPVLASELAFSVYKNKNITAPLGLALWQTGRSAHGLYELMPLDQKQQSAKFALDKFWQDAFIYFYKPEYQNPVAESIINLETAYPAIAKNLQKNLSSMLDAVSRKPDSITSKKFWKNQPAHSQLFAGFIQMSLQNEDYSIAAQKKAIEKLASLKAILARCR